MNDLKARWAALSARLGVNPRQFAILAGAGGGGLLLLVLKFAVLRGPAAASASTPPEAAPDAAAPAPVADAGAAAPAGTAGAAGAASPAAGGTSEEGTLVLHLETTPARDPFASFIEKPPPPVRNIAAGPTPEEMPTLDLSPYTLRATMDATWAIIGGTTFKVGDPVGKGPDGTPIVLKEVAHRRAVLEWRGKTFDIELGG